MPAYNIAEILLLARIYGSAKGYSRSTVSLRIAKQGSLFKRLERGSSSLTLRRCDRIVQVFSDHWPEDLDWPPDIPRPEPSATTTGKAA